MAFLNLGTNSLLFLANSCFFCLCLLGYSIENIVYFYYYQPETELGETLYFNLQMPFKYIEPVLASESCSSGYEPLVLYDWEGATDSCDCDFGRDKFECTDLRIRSGCSNVEGVDGDEFEIWKDIQFCGRRYSLGEFTYFNTDYCAQDCGTICMLNVTDKCPVSSIEFVGFSDLPGNGLESNKINNAYYLSTNDGGYAYGYNYNSTHLFVVYYGSSSTKDNYIVNFQASFNSEPCFIVSRQPEWAGEELKYLNQEFGCDFGRFGIHPTVELIDNNNGRNFFKENDKNGLFSDLDRFSENSVESLQNQTVSLYSIRRLPLTDQTVCWMLDPSNFLAVGKSLDPGVDTFLVPATVLGSSIILFLWVWWALDKKSKFKRRAIIGFSIFLVVQFACLGYILVYVILAIGEKNMLFYSNYIIQVLYGYSCFEGDVMEEINHLYFSITRAANLRYGLFIIFLVLSILTCVSGAVLEATLAIQEFKRWKAKEIERKQMSSNIENEEKERILSEKIRQIPNLKFEMDGTPVS